VVQRRKARRVERPQRRYLGHQSSQQQRLQQPCIVAQVRSGAGFCRPFHHVLPGHAMAALQCRQELLGPELLRVVELDPHALAKGLVASGDGIPQIAYGDQRTDAEVVASVHQHGEHQPERRALPLQHLRRAYQGLHQRRAERVDLPKHRPLPVRAQQRLDGLLLSIGELAKGVIKNLACRLVPRP
jgi:hypothetical protein